MAAYLQSYMLTKKPSLHPKSKVLSIASRTSHTYPETRQKSNFLLVRPGNWLHSTKFVFILGWKYFCCLITTFLNHGIRVSCQPPSFLSFFESGSTIDSRSTIDSGLGQTEAVTMMWLSLTPTDSHQLSTVLYGRPRWKLTFQAKSQLNAAVEPKRKSSFVANLWTSGFITGCFF